MWKTILELLIKLFGNNLSKIIVSTLETLKSLFSYKSQVLNNKISETQQKKQEEYEKKVDEVVDNGTLNDLLNLRK